MRWVVTQPPAVEPITYQQVKDQCSLTLDDDEDQLRGLIVTARSYCEKVCHRSLITQQITATWFKDLDKFKTRLELPRGPVQAIVSVTDSLGNVIDPANYELQRVGTADYIYLKTGVWPLTVVYTAGFGNNPTDVPAHLRQGMLMHAAHLWRYREVATEQKQEMVAVGLDALYMADTAGGLL